MFANQPNAHRPVSCLLYYCWLVNTNDNNKSQQMQNLIGQGFRREDACDNAVGKY